jgi:hypothetical protein
MALATSSAKCRPGADGLVRAARARRTASITSIQASCGFACSRIVPKKPRLSFALGSVEDPFSIVALRYPGDRMHALLGPEVKPNSEEFQCVVRAVPIIFGTGGSCGPP